MKNILSLYLLLLLCCARTVQALEWFSDKPRAFNALLADPREAQARMGYLLSGNGKSHLDLGFGGHLGLVRQESATESMEGRFSLDVKGLITARFAFNPTHFDYLNGDMIGGLASTYHLRNQALELFYFHQSSHLGADALVHSSRRFKVFSYEALRLLHSHSFGEPLRIYGGMEIKVRANPSSLARELTGILGGDWHFLKAVPSLFTAVDLRFKGENDWALNSSFVVGYELGNPATVIRRQRVFIEIFNGYSNQGQFSDERECYVFLGMGFTL